MLGLLVDIIIRTRSMTASALATPRSRCSPVVGRRSPFQAGLGRATTVGRQWMGHTWPCQRTLATLTTGLSYRK